MTDYSNNTYEASIASNFIRSVYSYMFIAMAVSGVIAYAVGTNKVLFDQLFMRRSELTEFFVKKPEDNHNFFL
jgi:FtsH-binding integral membrane protein